MILFLLFARDKGPIDMSGSGDLKDIKEFGRKDNTIFLIHGYFDNSAQQFLDFVRPGKYKNTFRQEFTSLHNSRYISCKFVVFWKCRFCSIRDYTLITTQPV